MYMKKAAIKKLLCFLVIFIFLMLLDNRKLQYVCAAGMEDQGMDIVIIIDTSGSMKSTDSERIAIEAAKLFIDMMETSGSRIGVVSFSDLLGTVIDMTDIKSQSDKEDIKQKIERLSYEGDTDIGLALQKGYDILQNAPVTNNQKAILFFTDGKIDLPGSMNRTEQNSRDDSLQVASKAAASGVPIYSIGLNSNGNVDQELISILSNDTRGRWYIVDSAEKLPEFFNEIFADFINSNIIPLGSFETDGINYVDIPFKIPNNSVLEANLIMLSDVPLEDVQVLKQDENGTMKVFPHVVWEESTKYSLVKLITPEKGDWILRIIGQEGCMVHVNLIFNYHVNLQCAAQLISDAQGAHLDVTAWMEKEGSKLTDADLYQAFTAKAYVEEASGIQSYDMNVGTDSFHVSIPADHMQGVIKVYSRIESASMYRQSEVVTIDITNNPPIISNIPEKLELSGLIAAIEKKVYVIEDCITDLNGDKININIEVGAGAEDVISAEVTDKEITIRPGINGSGIVTITATDSHGAETSKQILVTVNYKISILQIVWAILLMILVVAALFKLGEYLKSRNSPFYGAIRWSIVGQRGRTGEHCLDYEKGCLALGEVIKVPEAAEFILDQVKMRMNKTVDGIWISNESKKCSMAMGYGAQSIKKAEIRNGEFVILNGQYMGDVISLRIEYGTSEMRRKEKQKDNL